MAMRGACSICSNSSRPPQARPGTASTAPSSTMRCRAICAVSTRAATPSTTRSRPCTRACAAPAQMPRCTGWCACSMAAPNRCTSAGGSALHKSVRGSSPDAALYWMVRMLDGGAEPLYVGRRLVRMAMEDVGLADPRALRLALDACETYERLGSPEGELALAEAVIYLACAAKSNAVYVAYNNARTFVGQDKSRLVPEHLRNAPTKLMKEMGYCREYRYAHDEPDAYAADEHYFPQGMPEVNWYRPTPRGLEARISEKLA